MEDQNLKILVQMSDLLYMKWKMTILFRMRIDLPSSYYHSRIYSTSRLKQKVNKGVLIGILLLSGRHPLTHAYFELDYEILCIADTKTKTPVTYQVRTLRKSFYQTEILCRRHSLPISEKWTVAEEKRAPLTTKNYY